MNPVLPLTKFDQIGVTVRDVDQAVAFMSQSFGIEFLTLEMPRAKAFLRGKEVEFVARIGIARVGRIDLELIQILEGDHIVQKSLFAATVRGFTIWASMWTTFRQPWRFGKRLVAGLSRRLSIPMASARFIWTRKRNWETITLN